MVIENIDKFSNEKLCEIIASHRYLGVMKDEAILCMEELARRRKGGDLFDFEKRIIEILSGLPRIDKDLYSLFRQPLHKIKL